MVTDAQYLPKPVRPAVGRPAAHAAARPIRLTLNRHALRLTVEDARHLRDQLNAALFLAAKAESQPELKGDACA